MLSAIGVALAALAGPATLPALAQDAADDVPIGTFLIDGAGADVAPQGGAETEADSRRGDADPHYFFQRFESDLQQSQQARQAVLDDAESEMQAGRDSSAQRLLEQLIADAPDTDEARTARRHLADLYRGHARDTRGGADLPWAQPSADRSSQRAKPARVSQAVEDQLVADAGDRVFFGPGSAELGTRALNVVKAQARFLQRRPELFVVVEGHTDDGAVPEDEDEKLATDRAVVVRDRLIAEGVDDQRITIVAKGRADRISACSGADCQAQNRRAVLVLMTAPGGVKAASASPREAASRAPVE